MGGNHRYDRELLPSARLLGSVTSGVLEIALFHPFDTTGKRLMTYQGHFRGQSSISSAVAQVNNVIFREYADQSFIKRYTSLYRGVISASFYKICQRVIRFSGQPIAAEYAHRKYDRQAKKLVGEKWSKPMIHACTGALIGVSEVSIVPLDILKIKGKLILLHLKEKVH